MQFPARGLYALTQTGNKSPGQILSEVGTALEHGVKAVQYRDKNPLDALALARELVKLCHAFNVPLLINDDCGLALAAEADGVHLGREDGGIKQARERLGAAAIIGVSCYNSVELALAAEEEGADYVAFGRFFPSSSKPLAAPAELASLHQARQRLQVPIVAIGGITPENGGVLLDAGADLLAVIGGLFNDDVERSAKAFRALFPQ